MEPPGLRQSTCALRALTCIPANLVLYQVMTVSPALDPETTISDSTMEVQQPVISVSLRRTLGFELRLWRADMVTSIVEVRNSCQGRR